MNVTWKFDILPSFHHTCFKGHGVTTITKYVSIATDLITSRHYIFHYIFLRKKKHCSSHYHLMYLVSLIFVLFMRKWVERKSIALQLVMGRRHPCYYSGYRGNGFSPPYGSFCLFNINSSFAFVSHPTFSSLVFVLFFFRRLGWTELPTLESGMSVSPLINFYENWKTTIYFNLPP